MFVPSETVDVSQPACHVSHSELTNCVTLPEITDCVPELALIGTASYAPELVAPPQTLSTLHPLPLR